MNADDVPKPCLARSDPHRVRCTLPQGHDGEHTAEVITEVRRIRWVDEPAPRPDGQQIAGAIITTLQQRGYSLPATHVHALVDAILDL